MDGSLSCRFHLQISQKFLEIQNTECIQKGTMSEPRSVMLFESRESVIEDAIRQGLGNVVCVKVDPSQRTAQRFQQSMRQKELVTFKDENRVCPSAQSVDVVTQTVSGHVCALPEFDQCDSSGVVRQNLAHF